MQLQTFVDIPVSSWKIGARSRLLFVGSCFADHIGQCFTDDHFSATVNPYGVMYNPVSVLHTVRRWADGATADLVPDVVVLTLGTNHVYVEKATGDIVDNCRKRPQQLFEERELTVDDCVTALTDAVGVLCRLNAQVKVIVTVSPIRYRKYGYHGSRLSKAVLLLAVDRLVSGLATESVVYFPSYEIVLDELRDYRFYEPDMLHPSRQTVEYIYERFRQVYFSDEASRMLQEWRPIREALAHRPFHPDSTEYQRFLAEAQARQRQFEAKWFAVSDPR